MRLVVVVAIAELLLLLPAAAQACTCLPLPGRFEGAAKLVTARIAHVDRAPFDGPQTIELAVEETWKGSAEPRLLVELATQSSACGFRVEEGQRVAWMLYSRQAAAEPRYQTNLCLVPSDPAQSLARIEPEGRDYRRRLDAAGPDLAARLDVMLRAQDHEAAAPIVDALGQQAQLAPKLRLLRGTFFYQTKSYERAVDELRDAAGSDEARRLLGWARIRIGDKSSSGDLDLTGLEEWHDKIDLAGVDLHDKAIGKVRLRQVDLRGANLRGATFSDGYLGGRFEGADLRDADLRGLRVEPWNGLRNVDLRGARLGNWTGVSFDGADLRGAVADGADLHGCVFSGAKLDGASFRNANLRRASLHGSDLSRAQLDGADLHFAGYDERTRFPDGFDPEAMVMQRASERPISDARRRAIETFYGRSEGPASKRPFPDAFSIGAYVAGDVTLPRAPAALSAQLGLRADLLALYVIGNDLIAIDPTERRVVDRMNGVVS